MSREWKVIEITEAKSKGYPDSDWLSDWDDYGSVLYEFRGGKPFKQLASDGGEPEDNTLSRDHSWIAGALQEAYDDGLEEGRESGHADGYETGYENGWESGYDSGYEVGGGNE